MDFRELIQIVKDSLFCQVCGQNFDENKIELTGYQGNALYFHAFCDKGHFPSNSLIKAVAPSAVAVQELVEKFAGEPMTIDDFLDVKNFLKAFSGNFEELSVTTT